MITVITVCYNEEKNLDNTILSVLRQINGNYEYIICDGGSTDQSVRIAESYQPDFQKRNISYRVYSEKDNGVFFGMNNGIRRSEGDYIVFLNAGDRFHDEAVLKDVSEAIDRHHPDVLYGTIVSIRHRYEYCVPKPDDADLEKGMSCYHPAVFVKSEIIKKQPFDTTYQIAADYHMLLKLKKQNKSFCYFDRTVSDFDMDGMSAKNIEASFEERFRIWDELGVPYRKISYAEEIQSMDQRRKRDDRIPGWFWFLWNGVLKRRTKYVPLKRM